MEKKNKNSFAVSKTIKTGSGTFSIFSLQMLADQTHMQLERLPFCIRILLENALRMYYQQDVNEQDILNLSNWKQNLTDQPAIPFFPGRVLLQDFTGVPVLVDLAAMRSAVKRLGGNPGKINPLIPVDLVIDHSLQVEYFGQSDSMMRNLDIEYERNRERYEFLHWGQNTFENLRIVPPGTGIVHQVNLEFLSPVVLVSQQDGHKTAYPDTVVGTDSHTTMINGLGVLGWGVGGIEATSAMLKQPLDIILPNVIGFKLSGDLPENVTPTDLTLTITQILRKIGVVNKFVEFFGPALSALSLPDRAMIANMSPESGATVSFFPIDDQTINFLRLTGRADELVELVEIYSKEQTLYRDANTPTPDYSEVIEFDLGTVQPSLAGPRLPHERTNLYQIKSNFQRTLSAAKSENGFGLPEQDHSKKVAVEINGESNILEHGSVVIAAITSCTNTSNPFAMISAGLLAKKSVEKGLRVKRYVKTSLAPGSRIVTQYLELAGLMEPLETLGFNLVGYGCATCIGNSGPLPVEISDAVRHNNLVVAAVLSGNRNFEGRVHPLTRVNYLASPALVVAYALAGTINIDMETEPLGMDANGSPVYLKDIYPTQKEVLTSIEKTITKNMFMDGYKNIFNGNEQWNKIHSEKSEIFPWRADSTYIREPPYFQTLPAIESRIQDIQSARVLAILGDSITTDHISPAGDISEKSDAGEYLKSLGVEKIDFNAYGARRGNHEVMMRGTFANIRLKNLLLPGVEGGFTLYLPDKIQMSIYEAAMRYRSDHIPLIILAGKEYGSGSSRDWAAKGPMLLGVKVIIAESYERIHRSNLVGMGILPLQFLPGDNSKTLRLTGHERFSIHNLDALLCPKGTITITVSRENNEDSEFKVLVRLDTSREVEYFRKGGILHSVLF